MELQNTVEVLLPLRDELAELESKYQEELNRNKQEERMDVALKEAVMPSPPKPEPEIQQPIIAPASGLAVEEEVKIPGKGNADPIDSNRIMANTPVNQLGSVIYDNAKNSHSFQVDLSEYDMKKLFMQSENLKKMTGNIFKPKRT